MNRLAPALGVAVACLALAASAAAMTYRGSGSDDPQMSVRLQLGADETVAFEYADVLVDCSNGESVREPGAEHLTSLNELGRFRDAISEEVEGGSVASSSVRGRVGALRARGTVNFDLVYLGGECHSGSVAWRAKRKKPLTARGGNRSGCPSAAGGRLC